MKEKLLVFKEDNYSLKRTISILILLMVIGGVFGFIYEELFYKIDLGYFVKRGSTYGPWIPIYAVGSLLIVLITYTYKNKPYLIFIINTILTGLLEFFTGLFLHKIFNLRLWDYNKEILNFGNINGYICLRSILFFGISSLFLIYVIIPILKKITKNLKDKNLFIISLIFGLLFLFDIIIYIIINYL